jgi:hypothetical protein
MKVRVCTIAISYACVASLFFVLQLLISSSCVLVLFFISSFHALLYKQVRGYQGRRRREAIERARLEGLPVIKVE